MKKFNERVLEHLSEYKTTELGIAEMGIFRYDGVDLPKAHILPKDKAEMNLLPLVRPQYETLEDTSGRKIKWHRYAHHLNSSQALAVNLFQPLLTSTQRREILGKVLGFGSPVTKAGFEHVPDPVEGTNVDFYVQGSNKDSLLIEVKFTETEFGRADDDEEHRKKYEHVYRERLAGIANFAEDERVEFFAAYQFFRNVLHAGPKGASITRVWFLVPRENDPINKAAQEAMVSLKPEIVPHVTVVYLEDLLTRIEEAVAGNAQLMDHYAQFRQKYIVSDSMIEN